MPADWPNGIRLLYGPHPSPRKQKLPLSQSPSGNLPPHPMSPRVFRPPTTHRAAYRTCSSPLPGVRPFSGSYLLRSSPFLARRAPNFVGCHPERSEGPQPSRFTSSLCTAHPTPGRCTRGFLLFYSDTFLLLHLFPKTTTARPKPRRPSIFRLPIPDYRLLITMP
jgi:hypothetical protein